MTVDNFFQLHREVPKVCFWSRKNVKLALDSTFFKEQSFWS